MWNFAWFKIDSDFKRMCLIGSLHGKLKSCSEDDINDIKLLNDNLNLVKDINAIRLPILLGPLFWNKLISIDKVDLEKDAMINKIIRKMPCWIKYSDEANMRSDLRKLFCHYKTCISY